MYIFYVTYYMYNVQVYHLYVQKTTRRTTLIYNMASCRKILGIDYKKSVSWIFIRLEIGLFSTSLAVIDSMSNKKVSKHQKTQFNFISTSFTEIILIDIRIDIRIIDLWSHDSCDMNVSRGVRICTTSCCATPKTFFSRYNDLVNLNSIAIIAIKLLDVNDENSSKYSWSVSRPVNIKRFFF